VSRSRHAERLLGGSSAIVSRNAISGRRSATFKIGCFARYRCTNQSIGEKMAEAGCLSELIESSRQDEPPFPRRSNAGDASPSGRFREKGRARARSTQSQRGSRAFLPARRRRSSRGGKQRTDRLRDAAQGTRSKEMLCVDQLGAEFDSERSADEQKKESLGKRDRACATANAKG